MGDFWYDLDEAGHPVQRGESPRDIEYGGRFDPARGLRCWRVALTEAIGGTEANVSTVFLGLDHNWGNGPPILWESMAFNVPGEPDELVERYESRIAAVGGHQVMVAQVERIVADWQRDQQAIADAKAAREYRNDVRPARQPTRAFTLDD